MKQRVVLVLENAIQIKGLVETFDPSTSDTVSVVPIDDQDRARGRRTIAVERVRAAFFVHDLAPFRRYRLPDRLGPPQVTVRPLNGETRVRLELEWGERLHGLIRPHDPDGEWYAFVPLEADRAGNLIHALVASDAIVSAESLERE